MSLCFYSIAQNPVYKQFDKTLGLPSNVVYDVQLDDNGFVWLAHSKGISRFNGASFSNYSSAINQNLSVTNLINYKNYMFCQDFAGNFYYAQNDSLIKENKIPSSGNFYMAGLLGNNIVHFGTNNYGIFNIDNRSYTKKILTDTLGIANYFDNEKCVSLCYHSILTITKNKLIEPIALKQKTLYGHYALEVNNKYYGFQKNTYPYLFSYSNSSSIDIALPKNLFIQNIVKTSNEIWVCTSTGAYCFDYNFNPKHKNKPFFSNESISKVIVDKDGGYWFSTLQNGVLYVPNIYNNNILPNQNISALCVINNDVLAGSTDNNLFYVNNNRQIKLSAPHQIEFIKHNNEFNTTTICSDNFYVYENNNPIYKSGFAVKDVSFISKGIVLLNTNYGEYIYTKNQSHIPKWMSYTEALNHLFQITNTISNARGKTICYSSKDSCFYSSKATGFYKYANNKQQKILWHDKDIFPNYLFNIKQKIYAITTNAILLVKNNSIQEKPLLQLAQQNQTIGNATLLDSNIYYTLNNNIFCFNTTTNSNTKIWQSNGVLTQDINAIAVLKNQLYIGYKNGLLQINISNKSTTHSAPLLINNKFLVNDNTAKFSNHISFKENENNLLFTFACNAYSAADSLQYFYKINNENWRVLTNTKNELRLNQMGAADYVVQLKAVNENNVESNTLAWKFSIEKPFYKTPLFIILIALFVIAIIIVYYTKTIATQKQNNKLFSEKIELEKELQNSLMASIKSQMNPHFLFNALNTIQSYIYTNEKANATQYLSKFSKLTRKILEQSNHDEISLEEEIESISLYIDLENMRFENTLISSIVVDKNINIQHCYLPSMLIQPYVENAIKHGLLHKKENKKLDINFSVENNNLKVSIDDNGVGRKQSHIINTRKNQSHQSFALQANKKRLEILQADKKNNIQFTIIDKQDEQGNSTGTTVLLYLPYKTKQ